MFRQNEVPAPGDAKGQPVDIKQEIQGLMSSFDWDDDSAQMFESPQVDLFQSSTDLTTSGVLNFDEVKKFQSMATESKAIVEPAPWHDPKLGLQIHNCFEHRDYAGVLKVLEKWKSPTYDRNFNRYLLAHCHLNDPDFFKVFDKLVELGFDLQHSILAEKVIGAGNLAFLKRIGARFKKLNPMCLNVAITLRDSKAIKYLLDHPGFHLSDINKVIMGSSALGTAFDIGDMHLYLNLVDRSYQQITQELKDFDCKQFGTSEKGWDALMKAFKHFSVFSHGLTLSGHKKAVEFQELYKKKLIDTGNPFYAINYEFIALCENIKLQTVKNQFNYHQGMVEKAFTHLENLDGLHPGELKDNPALQNLFEENCVGVSVNIYARVLFTRLAVLEVSFSTPAIKETLLRSDRISSLYAFVAQIENWADFGGERSHQPTLPFAILNSPVNTFSRFIEFFPYEGNFEHIGDCIGLAAQLACDTKDEKNIKKFIFLVVKFFAFPESLNKIAQDQVINILTCLLNILNLLKDVHDKNLIYGIMKNVVHHIEKAMPELISQHAKLFELVYKHYNDPEFTAWGEVLAYCKENNIDAALKQAVILDEDEFPLNDKIGIDILFILIDQYQNNQNTKNYFQLLSVLANNLHVDMQLGTTAFELMERLLKIKNWKLVQFVFEQFDLPIMDIFENLFQIIDWEVEADLKFLNDCFLLYSRDITASQLVKRYLEITVQCFNDEEQIDAYQFIIDFFEPHIEGAEYQKLLLKCQMSRAIALCNYLQANKKHEKTKNYQDNLLVLQQLCQEIDTTKLSAESLQNLEKIKKAYPVVSKSAAAEVKSERVRPQRRRDARVEVKSVDTEEQRKEKLKSEFIETLKTCENKFKELKVVYQDLRRSVEFSNTRKGDNEIIAPIKEDVVALAKELERLQYASFDLDGKSEIDLQDYIDDTQELSNNISEANRQMSLNKFAEYKKLLSELEKVWEDFKYELKDNAKEKWKVVSKYDSDQIAKVNSKIKKLSDDYELLKPHAKEIFGCYKKLEAKEAPAINEHFIKVSQLQDLKTLLVQVKNDQAQLAKHVEERGPKAKAGAADAKRSGASSNASSYMSMSLGFEKPKLVMSPKKEAKSEVKTEVKAEVKAEVKSVEDKRQIFHRKRIKKHLIPDLAKSEIIMHLNWLAEHQQTAGEEKIVFEGMKKFAKLFHLMRIFALAEMDTKLIVPYRNRDLFKIRTSLAHAMHVPLHETKINSSIDKLLEVQDAKTHEMSLNAIKKIPFIQEVAQSQEIPEYKMEMQLKQYFGILYAFPDELTPYTFDALRSLFSLCGEGRELIKNPTDKVKKFLKACHEIRNFYFHCNPGNLVSDNQLKQLLKDFKTIPKKDLGVVDVSLVDVSAAMYSSPPAPPRAPVVEQPMAMSMHGYVIRIPKR